ncbi:MAG: deoxyribose-phosphate aldolase [Dysgonamonadaceae bacterium]|jgi:deoxyribose-phosphate aldolase|nr:deoxyribose-phosphate aldolase [Dysgonamonadaceae bacterium]
MSRYKELLGNFNLNLQESFVKEKTAAIIEKFEENNTPDILRFIYSCIDYTSLNSDDSKEKIWKFVDEINNFDDTHPEMNNVAAVCVYPNFVSTVKEALRTDVRLVAVAGGFPSSQTFMEIKIAEVSLAVADGADEIDIVLNTGDFFDHNFQEVCEEISEIKEACRGASLKVILETGLLKTAHNIKKAAVLSMFSGADFIKTSTGKGEYPGATFEAVYAMCEAIKEYDALHNKKTGIKIAGGVRTVEDALKYYTLVKQLLGNEWLTPEYFRIGASKLTDNILSVL